MVKVRVRGRHRISESNVCGYAWTCVCVYVDTHKQHPQTVSVCLCEQVDLYVQHGGKQRRDPVVMVTRMERVGGRLPS